MTISKEQRAEWRRLAAGRVVTGWWTTALPALLDALTESEAREETLRVALAGLLLVTDGEHCPCGDPGCTSALDAFAAARAALSPSSRDGDAPPSGTVCLCCMVRPATRYARDAEGFGLAFCDTCRLDEEEGRAPSRDGDDQKDQP